MSAITSQEQILAAQRAIDMHDHAEAHSDTDRLYALLVDLRHWAHARGVDFGRASAIAYDLYESQTGRRAGNCASTATDEPTKPWAMPETRETDDDF